MCLRRQLLLDDPPALRFLLAEEALLRGQDLPMMPQQVDHLHTLAGHTKLDIRVVPLAAGMLPTRCSFTLLQLADPPATLLYVEDPHSGGLVRAERPEDITRRRDILACLDKHAVPLDHLTDPAHKAAAPEPHPEGRRPA